MSLLGMPARRPEPGLVYDMPAALYDPTDSVGHPTLVVGVDAVRREALVATRTSKRHARGPRPVEHDPDPALGLDRVGWWRLHRLHRVPWEAINDDRVVVVGPLNGETWERVKATLRGTEEDR